MQAPYLQQSFKPLAITWHKLPLSTHWPLLGVHANTINAWKARDLDFPAPIRRLRGIDLWDDREVVEWATRTGRNPPRQGGAARD